MPASQSATKNQTVPADPSPGTRMMQTGQFQRAANLINRLHNDDLLCTVTEMGRWLGVASTTVRGWVHASGGYWKRGPNTLISQAMMADYLMHHRFVWNRLGEESKKQIQEFLAIQGQQPAWPIDGSRTERAENPCATKPVTDTA